jgi:glycine cleavage system H lipoate-binding protein
MDVKIKTNPISKTACALKSPVNGRTYAINTRKQPNPSIAKNFL